MLLFHRHIGIYAIGNLQQDRFRPLSIAYVTLPQHAHLLQEINQLMGRFAFLSPHATDKDARSLNLSCMMTGFTLSLIPVLATTSIMLALPFARHPCYTTAMNAREHTLIRPREGTHVSRVVLTKREGARQKSAKSARAMEIFFLSGQSSRCHIRKRSGSVWLEDGSGHARTQLKRLSKVRTCTSLEGHHHPHSLLHCQ